MTTEDKQQPPEERRTTIQWSPYLATLYLFGGNQNPCIRTVRQTARAVTRAPCHNDPTTTMVSPVRQQRRSNELKHLVYLGGVSVSLDY